MFESLVKFLVLLLSVKIYSWCSLYVFYNDNTYNLWILFVCLFDFVFWNTFCLSLKNVYYSWCCKWSLLDRMLLFICCVPSSMSVLWASTSAAAGAAEFWNLFLLRAIFLNDDLLLRMIINLEASSSPFCLNRRVKK